MALGSSSRLVSFFVCHPKKAMRRGNWVPMTAHTPTKGRRDAQKPPPCTLTSKMALAVVRTGMRRREVGKCRAANSRSAMPVRPSASGNADATSAAVSKRIALRSLRVTPTVSHLT
jgi:hypothetical protein